MRIHRVLLEVVSLTADVRRYLHPVGQTYSSDLAQGGVGLLRSRRVDPSAHPPLLRATLQRRDVGLLRLPLARLSYKLIGRRHSPNFRRR